MLAAFNNAKDLTNVVKVNFQQVESVPIRVQEKRMQTTSSSYFKEKRNTRIWQEL